MLRSLLIRDFVIVDLAEIHFDDGYTVLSGETGAGKSILIDALSLVLGARGDAAAVREGAARADLTAEFDSPAELDPWLAEHALQSEGALLLRRVIDTQARSRAYINGIPATLAQLRELGEHLIDIHGQHAHQSLLRPASQRDMLDAQGGLQSQAQAVQQAWRVWQQAEQALEQARQNQATLQLERERLAEQLEQLDQLSLRAGEWDELGQQHSRLAHAQALLEGATQAMAALDDEQASAQQCLGVAAHSLQSLLRHDNQLQGILDAIESARIATAEAVSDLNSYLNRLELDPQALEQAEQRMSAVFDTARRLRTEPAALTTLHEQLRARMAEAEAGADLSRLTEQAELARSQYDAAATQLSRSRKQAAGKLSSQVTEAMQQLAMEGGRFNIALHAAAPTAHGVETVEFLVAGHAGTQPRPLPKVASGGELARLSLALSVIASQAARVPTLIFDEVDAGVGGAVADVVGKLLHELGRRHQVLCVTHLPQVASRGDHHFRVRKMTQDGLTRSLIEPLDAQDRVEEIARMLGGLTITDTTRRHAQEMLAGQNQG